MHMSPITKATLIGAHNLARDLTLHMLHMTGQHLAFLLQSVSSGVCYIIAQCLGGILGAAGLFYSLPGQPDLACRSLDQDTKLCLLLYQL